MSKFKVGDKVIRIVENLPSVVLEVIEQIGILNKPEFIYYISYDESGNTGYWFEDTLAKYESIIEEEKALE
jgi:hypothetical protein